VRVEEHTTTIDQVPVFYRTAGGPWTGARPLYLHEALTSSDDWTSFLERTGGLAPDLLGFGRSGKGGHLDYSPDGIIDFLMRLLSELGVERFQLIGHGWGGALVLLLALREPGRVERLVLIDAVPLLDGFRWHRPARLWRRPVIGELVMGATSRRRLQRELRKATVRPDAWSRTRLNAIWGQFDQGTQRALLRLHRAADEARLAELGAGLGSLRVPALVVWGERDPWFPSELADAYGAMLPDATVERVPDAGHWPWLDQPQVIERVAGFVT
jgi:pimeloyl-ACP methyl ester carboxylesterase